MNEEKKSFCDFDYTFMILEGDGDKHPDILREGILNITTLKNWKQYKIELKQIKEKLIKLIKNCCMQIRSSNELKLNDDDIIMKTQ
jgi:hypothetical protein